MESRRTEPTRASVVFAFGVVYVYGVAALLYVNEQILCGMRTGLGDAVPPWDTGWLPCVVLFLPLALMAAVATWTRLETREGRTLLMHFGLVIALAIQLVITLGVGWPLIATEWAVCGFFFFVMSAEEPIDSNYRRRRLRRLR